ncbi:23985_t:CDS:2, partial [Racocetra persica]
FHTDDARVDYIVGSLELMRNMNQESDKLPWQIRLEEKQKRHFARSITHKSDTIDTIDTIEDSDMKRIALISQVQDLFPDLGEGFIEECLIAFDDNVEMIINRLLENSLPAHLNELDRSMARRVASMTNDSVSGSKEESLLAQRRNVFDNDEFDVFSGKNIDFKRVNKGKKNRGTADALLDDNIDLHMVDENDEETEISNTTHGKMNLIISRKSELIKAFQSDQSVFERTSAVRRSDKRARLKNITGMADEQLEG